MLLVDAEILQAHTCTDIQQAAKAALQDGACGEELQTLAGLIT